MAESENKLRANLLHVMLVIARLVFAALICAAMPFAHLRWGDPYPGDGQQAFGMILMFGWIGAIAGAVYLVTTSVLHYVFALRSKKWQQIALWDGILGALFATALFSAGARAKYVEEPNQTSEPMPLKRHGSP